MNAVVTKVVEEVKEVAEKIVSAAEVRAAEAKAEVVKVAERVNQELTSEEKLAIREIENSYLKAQMEIQRLSQITQNAQKDFTSKVEELTKKYLINPTEMLFDNISLKFVRKA